MRHVCQSLAADHFVLELDVGQLIFQLGFFTAFDHLRSWRKGYLELEVIVKGLGVENTMVSSDLMIEKEAVLFSEYLVQLVFSVDYRGFLVSRA